MSCHRRAPRFAKFLAGDMGRGPAMGLRGTCSFPSSAGLRAPTPRGKMAPQRRALNGAYRNKIRGEGRLARGGGATFAVFHTPAGFRGRTEVTCSWRRGLRGRCARLQGRGLPIRRLTDCAAVPVLGPLHALGRIFDAGVFAEGVSSQRCARGCLRGCAEGVCLGSGQRGSCRGGALWA